MDPNDDRDPGRPMRRDARVSCAGCGLLHAVPDLLAFHPVCPACAAGVR